MNNRPLSITVIGWVFIAVGCVALGYHLLPQHIDELKGPGTPATALVLICLIRALAIVGGVFLLRGFNWARWLVVGWLAYHVILSAFHSLFEVAVHGALFGLIAYFLFRQPASSFFKAATNT